MGTSLLEQSHREARRLIAGVRPPILDESGVVDALAHLVHEQNRLAGPRIRFDNDVRFHRLAPVLENAIYRICQEALTNACKYSRSPNARLSLLEEGDRVRLEIEDWGIGFETTEHTEGRYGLDGIRERARLLGGTCSIQSALRQGTRIAVVLPLVLREAEE